MKLNLVEVWWWLGWYSDCFRNQRSLALILSTLWNIFNCKILVSRLNSWLVNQVPTDICGILCTNKYGHSL